MNPCSALPTTGSSTWQLAAVAALLLAAGAACVAVARDRRRSAGPVIIVLAVGAALLMGAGRTDAASPCPPASPTTIPATSTSIQESSSTSTSSTISSSIPDPSSTSTSTSTTSTTLTPTAPVAVNDEATVVGGVYTFSPLTNDQLGNPSSPPFLADFGGFGADCTAFVIKPVGGIVSIARGAPGVCEGRYSIANTVGSSTATITITFVDS